MISSSVSDDCSNSEGSLLPVDLEWEGVVISEDAAAVGFECPGEGVVVSEAAVVKVLCLRWRSRPSFVHFFLLSFRQPYTIQMMQPATPAAWIENNLIEQYFMKMSIRFGYVRASDVSDSLRYYTKHIISYTSQISRRVPELYYLTKVRDGPKRCKR